MSAAVAGKATSAQNIAAELEITEDGYIYIYVANETQGVQVNFDDLTVTVLGFRNL